MDKLEEVRRENLSDHGTGIRSQRDLEEEVARREVIIKQQSEALQQAENEILRLRAELCEYYKMVIQNQHQQIQELSAAPDSG